MNPYPPAVAPAGRLIAHLDFTVRIVRTEADLLKAVKVRHDAYARHKPTLAEQLRRPEPDDTADNCFVLLVERKLDQVPLGTMRVQMNDVRPLPIEQRIELPHWLQGKRLAQARRLGVAQGQDASGVRIALCKASFLRLHTRRVDWSLVGARPPLNKMYERLLFTDILDGRSYIPDPVFNEPHQALAFEIATGAKRYAAAGHPLTNYMVHTVHPDIDIGDAAPVL